MVLVRRVNDVDVVYAWAVGHRQPFLDTPAESELWQHVLKAFTAPAEGQTTVQTTSLHIISFFLFRVVHCNRGGGAPTPT